MTPLTIKGPARVIDGDTIVVGSTHVRLNGVDAAELGTARGENARAMIATLVTYQANLLPDRREDLAPRGRLLCHKGRHRHCAGNYRPRRGAGVSALS